MEDFSGRTAVVTGAASGIGRALADACADEGMNVVLADVEADSLRAARDEIERAGGNAIGVVTDVTQPDALRELADRTLEVYGGVHLLCNNAGVFAAGGPVWETPLSDFDWQFAVNVMGIVHGLRTFVPILLDQAEPAHIVNTASMAAVTTSPLSAGYFASKHAALSLSETLYHELTQRGAPIGVSVLCPELVDTRIGHAERNRPGVFARKDEDEGDHPERDVVETAIREFTKSGAPPPVLAERVITAVRENRFYVLSPAGNGWRRACETRLDDIRTERNPTFVPTTTND
jgi:NAD(P)-dependent dehydrogenase (short-subunit alcohol dehydrogenase family)